MSADKRMVYQDQTAGGQESYELVVENRKLNDSRVRMLYDPNDSGWTDLVRGKTACRLHDDGNGVKIVFDNHGIKSKSKAEVELDYSNMLQLFMLLDYYYKHSNLADPHLKEPFKLVKYEPIQV